ncbi:hypothetical protein [Rhodopirellula sallentina]|uniref:Uncharacterized protein n=1 Tax=Rhodopirellula sallentina SM41 TaxID=1263870 RepID=M5U3N3_9BACT|nr:hypothetical protein [Rhodopirellula sallentina]EMI56065.1 hypothetical protein RSSM_02498 [Rhodopirellula sallentina SM41]
MLFVFAGIAFVGCDGDSSTVIAPPEGAREMTPEELAEFNANAAADMEPVIQD